MKLAFSKPWRSKVAIHWLSRISVLRPGMAFMCCALTRMTSKVASRMLKMGRQYTPVDSMATWLTSCSVSQSASSSKWTVVVAKVRTWRLTLPCAPLVMMQATTVFLCTSRPAQHGYKTIRSSTSLFLLFFALIAFGLSFCYTQEEREESRQSAVRQRDTRFLLVLAGSPVATLGSAGRTHLDQLETRTRGTNPERSLPTASFLILAHFHAPV